MKKRIYFLMALLIFALSCATTGDVKESSQSRETSTITGIDIQDYTVTVTVNKPFIYITSSIDPHRMVVELPDVSIGAFKNKIVSDKAGIAELVPSQSESQFVMARLEILLQTPSRVKPEYKDNTLIIRLENPSPPPPASSEPSADKDYVIGDGDTLQISVWGESQLNAGVIVRPDGKITLPGVGDITASGFTLEQLSKRLTEKLETLVKKPIVTVTATGITNNKVYVFGGGTSSGVQNLPGRTTLLKFLCGLGNLKNADLEHAYILRNNKRLDVDFYALFVKGDMSKDILLNAEDIIYMPDNELKKIYVMGAVNAPKYIQYRQGIKILDVIIEAGGFTKFARENNVLILRKNSEQTKEITVKVKDIMKEGNLSQNIYLMPGDFVIVKEGIF